MILTSSVFEPLYSMWENLDTTQEPRPLLLVNLSMVPHTEGDAVTKTQESVKRQNKQRIIDWLIDWLIDWSID